MESLKFGAKLLLLVFEGVVGVICCYGVFEFWSIIVPTIFQKLSRIEPRVPHGKPTSVQGIEYPSEVPENKSRKNALAQETLMQMIPKYKQKSELLA